MKISSTVLRLLAGLVLCGWAVCARENVSLDWWREARFGMFVHWGPVAISGQEISWSRTNSNTNCPNNGGTPVPVYDNLYRQFNPTNFNADEWVSVARRAGMRYIVPTVKHCDGFLLWKSKVDGYNIGATPFGRDVAGELARAARKQNLRIGWYFSPMDWRDPDFRTERNAAFLARMHGELRELLGNYGRIDLLWFDWDTRQPAYDQRGTYTLVRKLQPQIIINNRLDLGPGDSDREIKSPEAGYYTPEQQVGAFDNQRPWETCMTLGNQWSWKPNDEIKGAAEVAGILSRTIGGDGNLLLNVGPMPDGRIEPRQVEVLEQVGRWVAKNSEAIYGTRGGPWKPTRTTASTRKGDSIYIHVLRPGGGMIELPALKQTVKSASVLADGKINFEERDGKLRFTLPQAKPATLPVVIKLKLSGSAMDLPAIDASAGE